jgi:HSP90 family molecular chaperone
MGKILENQVKEVKISNRLSESPSCEGYLEISSHLRNK